MAENPTGKEVAPEPFSETVFDANLTDEELLLELDKEQNPELYDDPYGQPKEGVTQEAKKEPESQKSESKESKSKEPEGKELKEDDQQKNPQNHDWEKRAKDFQRHNEKLRRQLKELEGLDPKEYQQFKTIAGLVVSDPDLLKAVETKAKGGNPQKPELPKVELVPLPPKPKDFDPYTDDPNSESAQYLQKADEIRQQNLMLQVQAMIQQQLSNVPGLVTSAIEKKAKAERAAQSKETEFTKFIKENKVTEEEAEDFQEFLKTGPTKQVDIKDLYAIYKYLIYGDLPASTNQDKEEVDLDKKLVVSQDAQTPTQQAKGVDVNNPDERQSFIGELISTSEIISYF